MKLGRIPSAPRLAGKALAALARLMRAPMVADALAGSLLAGMGLAALRAVRPRSHAPALRFRAGARARGRAPVVEAPATPDVPDAKAAEADGPTER